MGLSVKWTSHNVGAASPEQYGDYYAWGETEEKAIYSEDSYAYYKSGTGYVHIGNNISGTQYDVARVKWGGKWRMPTADEIEELCDKCTWKWTTYKDIKGLLVIGPNGNSIFLPAAGSAGVKISVMKTGPVVYIDRVHSIRAARVAPTTRLLFELRAWEQQPRAYGSTVPSQNKQR